MVKDRTSIQIDRYSHTVFRNMAKIKRWELKVLMRVLAEVFANGLDMVDNEDVDISVLRELYSHYEVAVLPTGSLEGA